MKKAVFFDIDGTLLEMGKPVLESTVSTIRKLRENGHLAFICSGRARVMIPEDPILEIGFDGVISACGMHGEYENQTIFSEELPPALIEETLNRLEKYHAIVVMEGNDNLYYSRKMMESREKHWFEKAVEKALPDNFLAIEDHFPNLRISKWSSVIAEEEEETFYQEFSDRYEVLRHENLVGEFVAKGHSKGNGIRRMCDHLGVGMEQTVAIGDSVNDVEMLRACAVGVAMGNSSQIAIENADFVTKEIGEHGIEYACRHLGLI